MRRGMFLLAVLSALIFVFGTTESRACVGNECGKLVTLDFVNIGTEADEISHEAAGWGPIEPDTHPAPWGNIATELDCGLTSGCDRKLRVTWAGDCAGQKPTLRLRLNQTDTNNKCLPPAGTQPPFAFDAATTFEPDAFGLLGRAARVVLDPNASFRLAKSRQLVMRVLDSTAYDAFDVFVRNIKKVNEAGQIPAKPCGDTAVLVYRFDPYAPENLKTKLVAEQWRIHTIDLTDYDAQLNLNGEPNALEVIIQATAFPWGQFNPFGQLAVDWIELLGDGRGFHHPPCGKSR